MAIGFNEMLIHRNISARRILFIACMIWVMAGISFIDVEAASAVSPAPISVQQLRSQIAKSQAGIRAFYVEYQSSADDDVPDAPGRYLHRFVAAERPDKFYHWSTKGTSLYSWQDDPLQQRLILTRDLVTIEYPNDLAYRVISLPENGPLPGTAPLELLWAALGWWPFDKRPAPLIQDDVPTALSQIIQSSKYVMGDTLQRVDGRWCYLLEFPFHDRLWFDSERDCALLAREVLDPQTGTPIERFELKDQWQVQPQIWVPRAIHHVTHNASTTENPARQNIDTTLKILDIRVNEEVPRSLFSFRAGPGAIRIYDDGHFEQQVVGGMDYMDGMVDWLKRMRLDRSNHAENLTDSKMIMIVISGVILYLATKIYLKYGKA
jgi:hypothetical protein